MAIQGFFTGDVKIRELNGVLKAVNGIVEVATDAGTVTSVGLTVGSTGTDVNVANSPITTSGSITLNLPTASATNRGLLSSADWTTFNSKQSALTFSAPLVNTSGTISIPAATSSVNGYLTSTDWSTFNSKQGTITLTTTGSSGAATLVGVTLNIPNYGSALTGYVPYTGATGAVNLGAYDLLVQTLTIGKGNSSLANNTALGYRTLFHITTGNYNTAVGYEAAHNTTTGQYNTALGQSALFTNTTGSQNTAIGLNALLLNTSGGSNVVVGLDALQHNTTGSSNTALGYNAGSHITGGSTPNTTASSSVYIGRDTKAKIDGGTNEIVIGYNAIGNGSNTATFGNTSTTANYFTGSINGGSFVKIGGTSSQFLKADGSVDSSTYYLASNPSAFIALTALSATAPLSYSNTTGVFSISQATTSTDGYLSSTDWNTFYNKQTAGSYITALTGEATASGPGSASVTLSTSAVTGKLLTGLNLAGGGTIAATDSILQAFGKVQNQISGMVGGVTFQGTWDASTNTPTLTSSVGTKGYYYIVSVAGSTNLNGITDWKIGDWAIFNGTTWDKVDNTDAVSSVNGFTGAVSLTTSNIAEGTNLYYLDSRARLALSFTAGSGAYNNTTGVITIPTNTSQLTNGANFITLSSLSASSPLSYNSGTGAFSIQVANGSQNGYLSSTDWTTFNSKQNTITLTTTGSSGSSTLVGATLNVPTYTLSGLGGVPTTRQLTINGTAYDLSADRSWSVGTHTGSLTSGYIPKATGTTSLTDSLLYDNGSAVLLGNATAGSGKFMVYSTTADNHYQAVGSGPSFRFADTITSPTYTGIVALVTATNQFLTGSAAGDMVLANNTTSSIGNFLFGTGATERMRINASTGNISINNTNNTYKLDVTGTGRFTGQLRLESTITDGTYTYTLPSATGTLALTSAIPANPVGGTGTTNYLPKFTGTSTIGDSLVYDNGTRVGINTASISNTTLTIYDGTGNGDVLKIDTNGTKADIWLNNSTTTNGAVRIRSESNSLKFISGSNERLFLDASGNLGLGVTPSAWASGYTAFQVLNLSLFGTSGLDLNLTSNVYYDGTNYKYISNGYASIYNQYQGKHYWSTVGTGTAGNAISFTQAMTLDASGRLGIGTTAPQQALHVNGIVLLENNQSIRWFNNASAQRTLLTLDSNNDFQVGGSISNIRFLTNDSSEKMRLNASGSLGIGTTTPNLIGASVGLSINNATDAVLELNRGNARAGFLYSDSTRTILAEYRNLPLIFFTNDTEKMRITSGGNVGIGTTSPTAKLVVAATTNAILRVTGTDNTAFSSSTFWTDQAPLFVINNTSTTANTVAGIKFELGNTNAAAGIGAIQETSNSAAGLVFTTGGAASGNNNPERMRITSGGRVGIGTSAPTQALHVVGNSYISGRLDVGMVPSPFWNARFRDYSDGSGVYIGSVAAGGYKFIAGDSYYENSGNWYSDNTTSAVVNLTGGNFTVYTNSGLTANTNFTPTARFNINPSGVATFNNNVGINGGSTSFPLTVRVATNQNVRISSETSTSIQAVNNAADAYVALKVDGSSLLLNSQSGANVGIGTTSPTRLFDVSATNPQMTLKSTTTTGFSEYYFSDSAGDPGYLSYAHNGDYLVFGVNSAERMRITSSGTLLVGTTTEGFLGKLQVAGSVAITGQYNTVLPSSSFSYFDGSGQVVSSSSSASALYLDTTWNTTGNPDGIYLNVTNTASGASSKLLNLKVGSVSQFNVSKAGAITTSAPSVGSAHAWKLGSYAAGGTGTATGVIYIEVNGQIYSIPALLGTP